MSKITVKSNVIICVMTSNFNLFNFNSIGLLHHNIGGRYDTHSRLRAAVSE